MDRISAADLVGDVSTEAPFGAGGTDAAERRVRIPDYLRDTYSWAYLNPRSVCLLDTPLVVHGILWGNFNRLVSAALAEFEPGLRVLQPACVYGNLSARLAAKLGPRGHLQVSDVAPVQIANCAPKLEGAANTRLCLSDAADHPARSFDAVCCFFLIHEVPAEHRRRIVDTLLRAVKPGGKIVFVDYHAPRGWHPLKPVMSLVFDTLEPFAKDLWRAEIRDFAADAGRFRWSKTTYFGGLYQRVVAEAV